MMGSTDLYDNILNEQQWDNVIVLKAREQNGMMKA